MKRFFAIFAIIAVLCAFCSVTAMAADNYEGEQYVAVEVTVDGQLEEHQIDALYGLIDYKAPTCTTDGYIRAYCTNEECAANGYWHEMTLSALGHDYVYVNSYGEVISDLPTCQQGGTAQQRCTRCGEYGTETRTGTAIDHKFTTYVEDENDCVAYAYHYECEYGCGTVATWQDLIDAGTLTKEDALAQIAAAEAKSGSSDPGQKEEDKLKGDAKIVLAAQLDADGNLRHNWTAWNVDEEATCESTGSQTRVCSICGNKEAEVIDKLDPVYEIVEKQLVDCTHIKVTYLCTICNCTDENPCSHRYKTETLEGDFHVYEAISEDTATCTQDGGHYAKCKYCGDTKWVETKALGHDWGEWTLSETYTQEGEGLVGFYLRQCSRCGVREELVSATAPASEVVERKDTTTATASYALTAANVTKGESGVTGSGQVVVANGEGEIGELYVRVAVVYENSDGEQILVVNNASVKEDGTFNVPSTQAPYGYTVKSVGMVAVTSDEAALTGAWSSYAVTNMATL